MSFTVPGDYFFIRMTKPVVSSYGNECSDGSGHVHKSFRAAALTSVVRNLDVVDPQDVSFRKHFFRGSFHITGQKQTSSGIFDQKNQRIIVGNLQGIATIHGGEHSQLYSTFFQSFSTANRFGR